MRGEGVWGKEQLKRKKEELRGWWGRRTSQVDNFFKPWQENFVTNNVKKMIYLTIANIPQKWVRLILILKAQKHVWLSKTHIHACFFHSQTNVCFSPKSPAVMKVGWNIPNLSKKIGNPGVRQRTHCNCPASNFLSGLLLYSSPIYYQSGPPNLPQYKRIKSCFGKLGWLTY